MDSKMRRRVKSDDFWTDDPKGKQHRNKDFKTFNSYCISILSDTTLTGVSPIIKSKGCFYKSVRFFILAFSIAGFLYQTFEFLQLYWEYSTVVSVKDMTTMVKPAITICDDNLFRRTYICRERPEVCRFEKTPEIFCSKYPIFCDDLDDLLLAVPSLESYPDDFFEMNFTKESGFQLEDALHSCIWYTHDVPKDEYNKTLKSKCGIPKYVRALHTEKLPLSCYALYSHTKEKNFTMKIFKSDRMLLLNLKWIVKEADAFKSRHYYLSFHHPGALVNPFEKNEGIEVQERRSYKIEVHQVNTVRLPPPYATECFDYLKAWNENRVLGPMSKQDCQHACEIENQLKDQGCVFRETVYPHKEKICPTSPPFSSTLNTKIRQCVELCKDACLEVKYVFKAEIFNQITQEEALRKYGSKSAVTLRIQFNVLESKMIKHRPKYESVELFSYIGGYLGMWLGWSLVVILDFLGTIIRLCKYPFMVKRKQNNANTIRTFNTGYYDYH